MEADDLQLAQAEVLRQIEEGGASAALLDSLRAIFAASTQVSERERFLGVLEATTRPLVEPRAVMQTSARLLAEHLGADRCAYANVENEAVFDITGDYARAVPSIVGRWDVAAFGPGCVEDMLAGRPYVVVDTDTDPRIPNELLASYRATNIRAVICVPLHKQGRFTAAMAVHQTAPRRWSQNEIELVTIVVGRCWEALERAAVERQLSQHRARLDYAAELAGIGFWYCDLPFDELMWDVRVKQHFFLPPEARVTIDTFYGIIHPDDREATRAAIDASIADHASYDVVYRTVDARTGQHKYVRALGGTAYAADGTPLRFDGVTVDVTGLKQAEERLRDQDRRKDEFLATLAHELRNPLAPIRTGLELIQATRDTELVSLAHQTMNRQLTHLVRMVDDLLDISRVTLGKVRLVEERVDLRDVITSAVETTRSYLEARGVELDLDPTDAPLFVHGDRTRLAQVIANLLHNAAKYTPRGGRVKVSLALRPGQAEIAVADTGIGISPQELPLVFEMFAQLAPGAAPTNGGLGIGLTLARRLVELHSGTIEARSDGAGRGATFVVRLPLLTSSDELVAAPVEAAPALASRRILVVDDNVDAADMLSALLAIGGHDVHVAHNGYEALDAVAAHVPEVVFLDIGMPGLDGYEVARRIRAAATSSQPILVALTGWGAADDRRKARDAGFDDHLVKPVEHTQITAMLAAHPRR